MSTQNKSSITSNITPINDTINIDNSKKDRGVNMDNNYVTRKELEQLEKTQDIKFQKIEQKIDHTEKHILQGVENMFLTFKNENFQEKEKEQKEREKNQRETRRWLIGIAVTIGIFVIKEFLTK